MPSLLDFLPMIARQILGDQRLARTPEPSQITDEPEHVVQYDRVMTTKLVVAYAAALESIHRAATSPSIGDALDLACGPGHFTLCLAQCLSVERVFGVDLSAPMAATAARNSQAQNLGDRAFFSVGDATRLEGRPDRSVDLCCFTMAAHHMPDLSVVGAVFREMERVSRPDGLIVVMDLVRLRTAELTERYVPALAHDYVDRGLPQFFADFRNSMYAAWTPAELRQALPSTSDRVWCHLIPRGLPTIQLLLGLPAGRSAPYVRSGWNVHEHPLVREWYPRWEVEAGVPWAKETLTEFRMLRWSLRLGTKILVRPTRR